MADPDEALEPLALDVEVALDPFARLDRWTKCDRCEGMASRMCRRCRSVLCAACLERHLPCPSSFLRPR